MTTDEIIPILISRKDENRIAFIKKNHPTQKHILGLSMPDLKACIKPVLDDLKKNTLLAKEVALDWGSSNNFELTLAAFLLLDKHKGAIELMSKSELLRLNDQLDNWVLVDYYGTMVTGHAWRKGILSFNYIKKWLHSANMWEQRLAITSCIGLDRGLKRNSESNPFIAAVCLALANHPDKMIIQAISWVLRFHIPRDKVFVEQFMEQNGEKFNAKIQREVFNKLQTGLKN